MLMAPLIVSLAVPIVLVATTSPTSHTDMIVRGVVTMVLVAVTIARLYVALDANSRAQQALVRRLDRDELTNLPTRTRFLDRVADVLEDTWRSEHHATLIQINIDRFKNINDTLGHESANRVLVSLAERLRGPPRASAPASPAPAATTSWCSTARRGRSTTPTSGSSASAACSRVHSSSATRRYS